MTASTSGVMLDDPRGVKGKTKVFFSATKVVIIF